ncbi:MAG: sigma-54-dependent Fis family transcriptional regulator [Chloroflexi bacterium]|nr:sigma-54-dependent Fis family transcriptional regulator [Chloroflexota bacterium]
MAYNILIVEDETHARQYIAAFLQEQGYEVTEAPTYAEAMEALRAGKGDIVLLDIQLPDAYGLTLLEETADWPNRPPVIVITGYGDIETAVDAMRNGAYDFLPKPVKFQRLMSSLKRLEEIVAMRRELALWRSQQSSLTEDLFRGASPAMRRVLEEARRAAEASVSVLITGETGTGKEVLARYIHQIGPRKEKPFVPINCAAVPDTMLESELFGYEAGAFTGATKRKPGLMEIADGGILFLDEIASMPLDMQAKLLRALENKVIRRMGGTKWIPVDIQIVAASNRDLAQQIREGKFREDLYYRLKVVDLHLPPLRERKEEIPVLVGRFIRELAPSMGKDVQHITPRALEALKAYDWPGNIRQLRNVIERGLLFCDTDTLDLQHLSPEILQAYRHAAHTP